MEKGDLLFESVCALKMSPEAELHHCAGRGRTTRVRHEEPMLRSALARSPHAGKGQTRLYFVMGCRAPVAASDKEYLLVWCMQVLSVSMQAYHAQVLVIRISR